MGHPNEEVVREYLRAFNEGDLARVEELLAEDIVIHFRPERGFWGCTRLAAPRTQSRD